MSSSALPLFRILIDEYNSQNLGPKLPEETVAQWCQHHEERLAELQTRDQAEFACQVNAGVVKEFYTWLHAHGIKRSALCFSGGGIRSATFGLGVVQGLSRKHFLGKFDYLSTVSGGGYLGSWLSAWIRRIRGEAGDPQQAVDEVAEQLQAQPSSPLRPEPPPISHLRNYSRYMSPKFGLLSADTWTLVATFLRNLILNWLVLVPLLAAVLMIPRVSLWLVRLGQHEWLQRLQPWPLWILFWLAVLLGAIGVAYMGPNRPSLAGTSRFPGRLQSQPWFLMLCQLPLMLMSVAITLAWAWLQTDPQMNGGTALPLLPGVLDLKLSPMWLFAVFGLLVHGLGFLVSTIWYRTNIWREALAVLITGPLGGLLAWACAYYVLPGTGTDRDAAIYACFATPLLLLLFFLATVLFAGLASHFTGDEDREWMARAAAWFLITLVLRAALAAIVIFGPVLLLKAKLWLSSAGGAAGLATLLLGRSKAASQVGREEKEQKSLPAQLIRVALSLAAPVFILFLLTLLSLGTTLLLWKITALRAPEGWLSSLTLAEVNQDPMSLLILAAHTPGWALVVVFLALVAVGLFFGLLVDINRFSLHGAYRERLIRAYLGASRADGRKPNPFTGFDPDDNVEMRHLRGNRPFHVLNMALNLVAGEDLAWQDRKAESFTVSPLHSGNLYLGYRDSAEYGRHRLSTRAISLGTALAISGAAASPNMGYRSSPVVTFLMALFNVRLGWWLGNPGPAGDDTYDTTGPRFAAGPLFAEALGLTNARHPYVYLSDGGHFENLALYEMVLRRCHYVVISDGGHDPEFTFEDLGNAVSKIRIDLGVPIVFERILLRPRSVNLETFDLSKDHSVSPYCAFGRICYSHVDTGAEDGWIVYIKPTLNGTEPVDVFNYARLKPEFPHEPTSDQLYTEKQFESYRALGAHVMSTILHGLPAGADLDALFTQVRSYLGEGEIGGSEVEP